AEAGAQQAAGGGEVGARVEGDAGEGAARRGQEQESGGSAQVAHRECFPPAGTARHGESTLADIHARRKNRYIPRGWEVATDVAPEPPARCRRFRPRLLHAARSE